MGQARKVIFGDIYNNMNIKYKVNSSSTEEKHYTGMHLVCIDWGGGYPMPGVKLGNAKDTPYKFSDIKDDIGLYTEAAFLKLWGEGLIKVYDETNTRLISSEYWNYKL